MSMNIYCYAILGLKREMPTQYSDEFGRSVCLPNGRVLSNFGHELEGDHELKASLELMGNEKKFLIGYCIAFLDHHNAIEIPQYSNSLKTRLVEELKSSGMKFSDDEIKLYLHIDSELYQH